MSRRTQKEMRDQFTPNSKLMQVRFLVQPVDDEGHLLSEGVLVISTPHRILQHALHVSSSMRTHRHEQNIIHCDDGSRLVVLPCGLRAQRSHRIDIHTLPLPQQSVISYFVGSKILDFSGALGSWIF